MIGNIKKSQLKKVKTKVRNIFFGELNIKINPNIGRKVNFVAKPKPQIAPMKKGVEKMSFI